MTEQDLRLPDFESPPLNEVALGIQSEKLGVTTPYLGLFWQRIRSDFPKVEIQPALDPVIERFGDSTLAAQVPAFRLMEKPETPRCWFIDSTGNRLVQLQEDRLHFNWRRVDDGDAYPRYPEVRTRFKAAAEELDAFVRENEIGEFAPTQCEVTYINHLPKGSGWEKLGDLHEIFTVISPHQGRFLPPLERANFVLNYLISRSDGNPIGRLHAVLKLGIRKRDSVPLLVFELTFRGRPEQENLTGALDFMDAARACLVRGFADLTRPAMHRLWRRTDG